MNEYPQALTIAGSDSGGGAGIQADLKSFQERHVFGTSVLTAVTAQNTLGVHDIFNLPRQTIENQLEAIATDFQIRAVKTGMLANGDVIQFIANQLQTVSFGPLVVDPVMVAKGGANLLEKTALQALKEQLIPLATIITPNLPEAAILVEKELTSKEAIEKAANDIQALGAKNVIIKGGHRLDVPDATDFLLLEDGRKFWLTKPRLDTKRTHGTGCTFSAVITAELAKGQDVLSAVQIAKDFIQAAIKTTIAVGHGHGPVNHWAYHKGGS
ncbi:bifunctional hydroxymethylpyrimidine kinase/phosphomethylpyrimidine kinase [Enterococcus sp. LJL98]